MRTAGVAASLRDGGPCPGQDATTIQSAAKPVPLPVKVGAMSKTTLAERGGYTQSASPSLFQKGSVDGNHPGKVTPPVPRPPEGRRAERPQRVSCLYIWEEPCGARQMFQQHATGTAAGTGAHLYDGHPCPSQCRRATRTREHVLCADHADVTAAGQHTGSGRRPDGHGCPSYSGHGLVAFV